MVEHCMYFTVVVQCICPTPVLKTRVLVALVHWEWERYAWKPSRLHSSRTLTQTKAKRDLYGRVHDCRHALQRAHERFVHSQASVHSARHEWRIGWCCSQTYNGDIAGGKTTVVNTTHHRH